MKQCILREDFLKLTDSYISAMILENLVSYTKSSFKLKTLIEEELGSIDNNIHSFLEGWFTKSYEQLSSDSLLNVDKKTIANNVKLLITLGYITEREHPNERWNKAKQYRVNVSKLQKDLNNIGFCLEGFPITVEKKVTSLIKHDNQESKLNYILKEWNRVSDIQGFPKVRSITGARKQNWLRILKQHPDKEFWIDFFRMLESKECKHLASASCNGYFWFNMDFFYKDLNTDRVLKVVEGFYKNDGGFSKNSYVSSGNDTVSEDENVI